MLGPSNSFILSYILIFLWKN